MKSEIADTAEKVIEGTNMYYSCLVQTYEIPILHYITPTKLKVNIGRRALNQR